MITPSFKLSADAVAIARAMESIEVGQVLTYEQITALVGRDFRAVRAAVASAARLLQRERRIVFGNVRNVGFMRLRDEEIVDTYDQDRARIRRQSMRSAKRLVCVDYDALPKEKPVKHNLALSMLGTITEISSTGSLRKVESAIASCGTSLPAAKTAIAALGLSVSA